ncbi:alpha/beta hydrolase [uncultured Tateyamaria sp.]|uniref:alpha/beta hydrolase n=1 Tax=uncultured Tateyamaria sp. TaxID=455651 RepID=UPI002622402A|nr:alpha/beta hydrolase [uncultured Tateyamaria sp.]
MPSVEAATARRALQKEQVDPSVTLADERRGWDQFAASIPLAADVLATDEEFGGVPCLRLRPSNQDPVATLLYAHGGGLTSGSITTHKAFCSRLAAATKLQVIMAGYRLLPEAPLTAPSDDFVSVFLNFSRALDDSRHPVFFAGDSSGAGLVAASLVRLRDGGHTRPAGWISLSGAFDASLSGCSMHIQSDPILSYPVLRHWQSHFPEGFDFENPIISPLFADLSNLPPALLLVGEDEVWRDDTERMHQALQSASSDSEMRIYQGMWHVWPMTAGLPETDDAFRRIAAFVGGVNASALERRRDE